jgi:hypothetical protein
MKKRKDQGISMAELGLVIRGRVAAHAFRRTRWSLRSVRAVTPWLGRFYLFVDVVSSDAWCQMTCLRARRGNPRLGQQTDPPRLSRGSELLSALSQLKHWNVWYGCRLQYHRHPVVERADVIPGRLKKLPGPS